MRNIFWMFLLLFVVKTNLVAQSKFNLQDAVVVGLFDQKDERFQMEILVAEIFNQHGVRAKVSLNYLKEGEDPIHLTSDSLLNVVKKAGFDTYVLLSVRGYDNRFKPSSNPNNMQQELKLGHLFPIYREGSSNVTFDFQFYRNNLLVHEDLLKIPSPSKEGMIKKLRKKLEKQIKTKW